MMSQALGHRFEDGVTGLGRRTARVDGVVGLGTTPGAHCRGLVEDDIVAGLGMASRAWGWCLRGRRCHRLGSRKMAVRKGV
jgi:hypothetical protein